MATLTPPTAEAAIVLPGVSASVEPVVGAALMNPSGRAVWLPYDWIAHSMPSGSGLRAAAAAPIRAGLERDSGIPATDLVDEACEPVGQRGVCDLQHVLGVLLAGMGEV